MTALEIVDDLTLRNRAYQVLYALSDSQKVRTLTTPEACAIIDIVSDIRDRGPVTFLDRLIWSKMSDAGMRYVVEGSL
jgi:hypothetical protein